LKLQMEAYARTHEEERVAQQQLEEDRKEEERMRRRLATREVERFRERINDGVRLWVAPWKMSV